VQISQSFRQCGAQCQCVLFVLQTHHEVVGVANDVHLTARVPLSPLLEPQIEHVVQIHVRQQGTDDPSLRPSITSRSSPSSITPAFSHFAISRSRRLSPIRCPTNFSSHT
jgi:hypothetical protein